MNDPCCWLCKTPSGVCATGHTCDHHREALAQEAGASSITYADPTGNRATGNVDRERGKKRGKRRT